MLSLSRPHRTSAALASAALATCSAALITSLGTPASADETHAPGATVTTVAGSRGSGPAVLLGMQPTTLAADAGGNLIVGDGSTGMIRRVDRDTAIATPIHGTGAAAGIGERTITGLPALETPLPGTATSLIGPGQATVAADGTVYIATVGGNAVRRIDNAGTSTIIAGTGSYDGSSGDGAATATALAAPRGVAVDKTGAVYIADTGSRRLRRVDPTSGQMTTIVTTHPRATGPNVPVGDGGPAKDATLHTPQQLAFLPGGDLLITDSGDGLVRRISAGADGLIDGDDTIATYAGTKPAAAATGDGGPADQAQLKSPVGIAVFADGTVAISEASSGTAVGRIRLVRNDDDAAKRTITTLETGPLAQPVALAATGRTLAWAEAGAGSRSVRSLELDLAAQRPLAGAGSRLRAGNGTPGASSDDLPAGSGQLANPQGIDVAADGSVWIADSSNLRVRRLDPATGRLVSKAGSGDMCGSTEQDCVTGGAALRAKLTRVWDVAADAHGNAYVLESNAVRSRISRYDGAAGTLTVIAGGAAGEAGLDGPAADARFGEALSIALSPDDKTLYVADARARRIRAIDLATMTTRPVAGTGAEGATGDGGAATEATLRGLIDIAVAPNGDLYAVDSIGNAVRRIGADKKIETVFADAHDDDHGHDHDHGAAAAGHDHIETVRSVSVGDDGRLAILDGRGGALYTRAATTAAGEPERVAGGAATRSYAREETPALEMRFNSPASVAWAPGGKMFISDSGANRIRLYTPAARPSEPGTPTTPDTAPVDPAPPAQTVTVPGATVTVPGPAVPVTATGGKRGKLRAGRPALATKSRSVRALLARPTVKITATRGARVTFRVTIERPRRTTVGSRTATSGRNGRAAARLRLGKSLRNALRRAQTPVRVRITAHVTGTNGHKLTRTSTVRLRPIATKR